MNGFEYKRLVKKTFTGLLFDQMGEKFTVLKFIPKCKTFRDSPAFWVQQEGKRLPFLIPCEKMLEEYVLFEYIAEMTFTTRYA